MWGFQETSLTGLTLLKNSSFPPSLSQKGGHDDLSGSSHFAALRSLEDGSHALRVVEQKVKAARNIDHIQGLDLLSPLPERKTNP